MDVGAAQVGDEVSRREGRALRLSALAGIGFAVLAVVWGLAARSAMILFDGVYAVLGVVLAWLGMRASRLVEAGPTSRYPFGREALAPLMVAVQALVLLGIFGYASVDALLVIRAGGSETAVGSAFLYSLVTLLAVLAVRAVLVRWREGSDLVAAEVAQWDASAVAGVLMVLGFGLAVALGTTSHDDLVPYVDPVLLLVATAVVVPTPVRMLRHAFRELLEGRPSRETTAPIEAAVARLRADLDLPEPATRIGKLGRKVYVELDFVVDEQAGWTVGDADDIRRRLITELSHPGQLLWLNVELHTDPAWDH